MYSVLHLFNSERLKLCGKSSYPLEDLFTYVFYMRFYDVIIYRVIHGGICTTLGNDSMSDSKQKSSYEHGSDFERLWSYDRLKLGIEGNNY